MIRWEWHRFEQLSLEQLYGIITIREAVFVVEQNCPYLDADGLDQHAWHLTGRKNDDLVAYLRIVDPGRKYAEPSIGRVITARAERGTGLGKETLRRALKKVETEFPGKPIRISAQKHLEKFYAEFNFKRVSDPYDEDGIPHIEMLREV